MSLRTILVVAGLLVAIVSATADSTLGQGGVWIEKTRLPTPRTGLAAGVVNGMLYTVGGVILYVGVGGHIEYLDNVEAYDLSTNSWTTKAAMPAPRGRLAVGVIDGIMYVLGGGTGQYPTDAIMNAYDPVKNAWIAKPPMPSPRSGYAVGIAKRTLYVVGGWGAAGPTGLTEAYHPDANRWRTVVVPMPSPRVNLAVGVVNGILFAVGGVCCNPGHGNRIHDTVEAYDPTSNTWTTKARMPTLRNAPVSAVVDQILYVAGGYGGPEGEVPTNTIEAYDPIRDAWTTKPPLPGNRNFLALVEVKGILYAIGSVSRYPEEQPPGPTKIEVDARLYEFKSSP